MFRSASGFSEVLPDMNLLRLSTLIVFFVEKQKPGSAESESTKIRLTEEKMKKAGQKNSIWAESYSGKSMEQVQRFPKSSWYREDLVPLLGTYITLECGNYEIEKHSGRANKAVLRNSRVKHINKSALKNTKVPDIEHLWVLLNPALSIDKQKPLKLTGVLYEYAHKNVRNIGMRVVGINQG